MVKGPSLQAIRVAQMLENRALIVDRFGRQLYPLTAKEQELVDIVRAHQELVLQYGSKVA